MPIQGITLEECVVLATTLGERIATELDIPVYLYEASARLPERKKVGVDSRRASLRRCWMTGCPARLPYFGRTRARGWWVQPS